MSRHIVCVAISLLTVLLVTGMSIGTEIKVAVVGDEGVVLRSAPRINSDAAGEMEFGEAVLLLERGEEAVDRWYRVERTDGQSGWLLDSVLIDSLAGTISGNRVKLRKGPGLAYGAIATLDKGTMAVVLERSDASAYAPEEFPWFKIAVGKRQGWVYGKYLHLLLDDAATVATSRFLGWRSWKSYGRDSAGRLKASLVTFKETVTSDLRSAFSGKWGVKRLSVHRLLAASEQYMADGQYEDAVDTLRQALSEHPTTRLSIGEMDGIVRCQLASILSQKLLDYDKAIEEYHKVIADHPASPIRGSQWNTTSDVYAADSIISICKNRLHDARRLLTECKRIIDESDYDVVKAMAHIETASVLRARKNYQGTIEHYKKVIERYPAAKIRFHRSTVHFAADALDGLVDLYTMTLGDFDAALEACNAVGRERKDSDLSAFAQYATAQIHEAWISPVDEVAAEYRKVPDFELTLSDGWKEASRQTAEAKLYELKWVEEYLTEKRSAIVVGSSVRLRESFNRSSKVVRVCREGETLLPLYPSTEKEKVGNYEDYWYKVRTIGGTIGWIYGQFLSFQDSSQ